MQHKATRSWSLPAVILALVLAAALVAQVLAQAAVSNQAFAAQTTLIADGNTTTSYQASLGDKTSTCYAGRVWTDKTVYTEDATFENGNIISKDDSNFLVAYSAMATSQSISGKTQVPVDVVFVIDNSNSMDDSVGNGSNQSRLKATVDAVNASITKVMESNENSRVAVVIYGLDAQTLLPLGHYIPLRSGNYIDLDSQYINGGWFESSGYRTTFTAPGSHTVTMKPSERGTNTHMGVAMGMNILANASPTSELPDGRSVQHVPALILLSDGASTAAGGGDWWNPSGQRRGDGVQTATSYAFAVAMNAMYMKQQVNERYGVEPDSSYATKIYTIGMGIEQLSGDDYHRAQMALHPGAHIGDNNEVAQAIKKAWSQYSNGKSPTLTYQDNNQNKTWSFHHPPQGDDIDSIVYNDDYFPAEKAEDVVNVFDNITASILAGAPFVPTQTEPNQPETSGYITYTDPIGPYMEVKDVKALLWSGKLFEQREEVKTSDDTTTYTFKGEIDSPVYDGKHNVSEIQITVTTDPTSQDQTLTVKIPASCIPLRVNTIMLDSDGKVESNQSNDAYPFRLLYTVDLKDDVITDDGHVNPDVVSKDYIDDNTEDGKVNFYSNQYTTGTEDEDGKTRGDATVTFTPASDNPFYFVQEDTPLYLDQNLTQSATEYNPNTTYYFPVSYYEGQTKQTTVVSRSSGLMNDYTKGTNGQLNLKAGSPRWGSLTEFIKNKDTDTHTTNTASTSYYPTLVDDPDSPTGNYVVYLGNNGKLQVNAPLIPPGDLTISKTVEGNQGETDRDFVFDVTLTNKAETLAESYAYTKTNADATQTTGTVSLDNEGKAMFTPAGETTAKALTLKHSETVIISGLPAGTSFTVTEQDPNTNNEGYTTSITVNGEAQTSGDRTVRGKIISSETQTVAYTNTWDVVMHTFTFTKIDGTDRSKPLQGARFKLFKQVCKDPTHNHESELIDEPFEPNPECWKLVTDADHPDGVFTSGKDGKISFDHLLANGVTYRLIEVQAPDGFQRPQGQWKLVIEENKSDGGTSFIVTTKAVGALNQQPAFQLDYTDYYLPNYRPIDPPITGGRGLTGFMLGGGLLIAAGLSAAAFWLIRSSKQKRNYRYR